MSRQALVCVFDLSLQLLFQILSVTPLVKNGFLVNVPLVRLLLPCNLTTFSYVCGPSGWVLLRG